ncbi:hypothetical protein FJ872_31980 [Mesorhizobium sp. B2-5-9]|uniref:hypothetical protein n=1 Tax=Mesorhizobium sp. B2-5-9 TaxID=2589921 RepID=UPI00112CA73F|nr:hypothetical protein [Mesorhizobium sp. B2-5-9]TPJ97634.1 hypothetical protein FJ872_31980 [Mesorhizobium sp. B2-5-9]
MSDGPYTKQIEHNPKERRMTNTVWWVLAVILALQWAGYLYFRGFDLWSIALGFVTGGILASWAIEISGNKWPFSSPGSR